LTLRRIARTAPIVDSHGSIAALWPIFTSRMSGHRCSKFRG